MKRLNEYFKDTKNCLFNQKIVVRPIIAIGVYAAILVALGAGYWLGNYKKQVKLIPQYRTENRIRGQYIQELEETNKKQSEELRRLENENIRRIDI